MKEMTQTISTYALLIFIGSLLTFLFIDFVEYKFSQEDEIYFDGYLELKEDINVTEYKLCSSTGFINFMTYDIKEFEELKTDTFIIVTGMNESNCEVQE